jgi:hypothetical protein
MVCESCKYFCEKEFNWIEKCLMSHKIPAFLNYVANKVLIKDKCDYFGVKDEN